MNNQAIIALSEKHVMKTYARQPVAFVRGKGAYLWDADGKKYLDFLAGIAVNGLGHSHPAITAAVANQAARLIHTSNLFYNQSQAELAELLCKNSFADKAFFCNSGAEANEASVKLARIYQKQKKGEGCFEILTMEKSFHGRTLGMIAATGQDKVKKGFEPLPEGFRHIPYDDLPALAAAVNDKTCAVLLEPVQGEGGVRYHSPGYLQGVRELCQKHSALLIYDEVQSGMGRTGRLFAYELSGVAPDIMSLAKSLGAGLPIGACLATDAVAQAFQPGSHASTFGGNFLVCEAAKAFMGILLSNGFLEQVRKNGACLVESLRGLQKKHPFIKEVRGEGLMIGIELEIPGRPLVEAALAEGLVINAAQEKILRLVPPLIIGKREIDEAIEILDDVFARASGGAAG
ncbi:MAG: acetylornithine transaminase [Deltaproteobacteria bacterium]|nr:acetylornithine transaminase [Deltaproteobacteria bacterium]